MGKENHILTIDVGSRSLKMAEFYFQDGAVLLTNFLSRRIEPQVNESAGDCFERNYTEMLEEGGFTATDVRLALPSSNSFQRLSKLPSMLGKSATVAKIIEFEAAQAVPYSMHEVEWGYQLLHHEWKEEVEETNEDGTVEKSTVSNEEYEALFVAVKTDDVVCYTDVIERSGKKIISVELSALNLFNAAVVSQINENECTLLLEIGAKGSCLMIADNRRIFMRNIPIGGDMVNIQIAKEFGVSDSEAEELKRRHGFVSLGGAYEEADSALASTISKIARNVMTRLHGEVSRSINVWRAQHNGNAPVKLLLAGGGSTMPYTTEFFKDKLRMTVEYLNSFGLITIGQDVDRNRLQTDASMAQAMIGMALHSMGSCPVDISLLPRAIKAQYVLDARKPYFYASAVALISCLLISLVGIYQELSFEQRRVAEVEKAVEGAKAEVASVTKVNGELNGIIGAFEQAEKYLNSRNKIGELMSVVQSAIPAERMWLVAFEPKVEGEEEFTDEEGSGSRQSETDVKRGLDRWMAVEDFGKMTELRQFRLVGYVVTLDGKDGSTVVKNFCTALEKNEMFEERVTYTLRPHDESNLIYFEATLTLKEALKK